MIEFSGSAADSVGMEMEFQLVDAHGFDLVDGVLPLLELYPDSINVKPEFIQNTIEVASSPCPSLAELERDVTKLVHELDGNCRRLGYRLVSGGTHPFSLRMAAITPLPRYLAIGKAGGYLGHNQITFATHVHVDVRSGDEAMRLMSRLKPYLPLLIAASANSPYWRAEDTGFAAFRHRILAPSRTYGLPPDFPDWHAFERFHDMMVRAGRIETINDIHWDIRPRPHLGTLEVRVMDAQTTIADAVGLAALVRGLVDRLRESGTAGGRSAHAVLGALPWWAHKDNCFCASRDGLGALLIADESGEVVPLVELLHAALAAVEPYATRRGEAGHLTVLRDRIDSGGPYANQRRLLDRTGSLPAVVAALAEELVETPC